MNSKKSLPFVLSPLLSLAKNATKVTPLGVMPGVVRTAAVSLLAVTGVYGSVSTPFAWLSPVAGSVLSPDDLLNASWCVSALQFRMCCDGGKLTAGIQDVFPKNYLSFF